MARLSYSSVNTYNTCGKKYDLHYNHGYREKVQRSSLLFGGSFDLAINDLLVNRDLNKAIAIFEKNWTFNFVHKVYTAMRTCPLVVYGAKDVDLDLIEISEEDKDWIKQFEERKKSLKWEQIPEGERSAYNAHLWDIMLVKAKAMITSYAEKVLPKFVRVGGVQEKTEIVNEDGDILIQYLDFFAELDDGSIVLFDNKTSGNLSYYAQDSAGKSMQLLTYFAMNKEKFNLGAVGYVAVCKDIIKNKTKKCDTCSFDGSNSKARSCDQEYPSKVIKRGKEVESVARCEGNWIVTLGKLEAAIKIIVNPVDPNAMDLALESFNSANHGIKAGVYTRNLSQCDNQYGSPCTFRDVCWDKNYSNVQKKED